MAESRRRIAIAAAALIAAAAGAAALGTTWPASGRPLPRAERVLLFGMPYLEPGDAVPSRAPALARLREHGASAVLSTRAGSARPTTGEGYAALGASARARRAPGEDAAVDDRARGGVRMLAPAAIRRASRRAHLTSLPGALGDALHAAGRRTAVVGSGAAAVALMDRTGHVDAGTVGPGRATPAAARRALRNADVVLVDGGDLDRAPSASDAERLRALRRADGLLGRLAGDLPPRTLLVVVSVSPAPGAAVTPVVAGGAGVARGALVSPSTKRRAIATSADIAPTVLTALGIRPPAAMTGHALRDDGRAVALRDLAALDRDTRVRSGLFAAAVTAHTVALGLLLAVLLAGRASPRWTRRRTVRWLALAVAAFPAATFLLRAIPDVGALGAAGDGAVLLGLTLALTAVASAVARGPLAPLGLLLAGTVAVLIVDVVTGSRLHMSSVFGFSLAGGGRFYGIPNTSFALIGAAALLATALAVERRPAVVPFAAAGLGLVAFVDGAPGLGSDVGGLMTMAPLFAVFIVVLGGRRPTTRTLGTAVVAALVILSAATALDLSRPADRRTHLGQFAADVRDHGPHVIADTIERKESANVRLLVLSPWSPMLLIAIGLIVLVVADPSRRDRLLPPGSALRAGATATVAFALIGFVLNDSGAVVIALALAYLCSFLALLVVHDRTPAVDVAAAPPAPEAPPAIVGSAWPNGTS